MCFENPENLAPSYAIHLSNTMGITKDNTNLGWGETFFSKLTDAVLNLKEY